MSKQLFFELRQDELAQLVEEIEQGDRKALTAYAEIKALKDLYSEAEKQIEPIAMNEAQQYSENTFNYDGFTFEKRNGATTFDYKDIPDWQEKHKALKECEELHKQAFIAKQKGLIIASEYGEDLVMPVIKYAKSSLVVKKPSQHMQRINVPMRDF